MVFNEIENSQRKRAESFTEIKNKEGETKMTAYTTEQGLKRTIQGFDSTLDALDAVQKTPSKFDVNAKQSALLAGNTEKAIHARGY